LLGIDASPATQRGAGTLPMTSFHRSWFGLVAAASIDSLMATTAPLAMAPGLLPDSLTATAFDQAELALDAKAEFSHEPALRGTRTAALTSEINSIAEVQELRAPGELSERQLEQVRLELAEATADQMEAEAIAAEELRKADRAAERIKQLKALELSDGFQASRASRTKLQPAVLSQSPEAIFFQRNRDLEDPAPEPPKQHSEAPKAEKAAANATNGTRTCDPSIKLSCTAQRVITLDYRLSMEAGCFEWAVLVSLWLGSVWFAYCFCGCRYSNFCYCQIWTCAVLVLLAMASVTSLMKTS